MASLETLTAAAAAVHTELAAFIQAQPGADLPRDIEHLRRQELVIRLAVTGGWRARPERPIDPCATRSRSIDVYLSRGDGQEVAVIEIVDLVTDVGDVLRGLADKVAAIRRERAARSADGPASLVAGLLVLRGTRRNRELVRSLSSMFDSRFPGPGRRWLQALSDPGMPMPAADGYVWSTVSGDRLFAARSASG